jgi:hypothetical protein
MVTDRLRRVLSSESEEEPAELLLNPWREVGWIFKDGEAVAIERHGDESRMRAVDF